MKNDVYDAYIDQELPTARQLRALFSPESSLVIFDVGACEGEDSIRYAKLFQQARIFSFEPLPGNQALILGNFERHQANRCELVPLALSDREGQAILHVSSGAPEVKALDENWNYGNKSSSLLPPKLGGGEQVPWLKFEETVHVFTDTLDHFCHKRGLDRVDFVHMDVQGAEYLVLQGAQNMLPKIKALWLEVAEKEVYQGQKLKRDIEAFMREAGFAITYQGMQGIEGDQFYVNTRFWPGRRRLAASYFECAMARILAPFRKWRERMMPPT